MLRRLLVASAALAVLAAFVLVSQPSAAETCAVLTENAIGLKQSEAADRAQKQLKRKVNRWMEKKGIKYLKSSKTSTSCNKKGSITVCTATAKVCG